MSLGEGRLGMEPGPVGQSREEGAGALHVCPLGLGGAGAADIQPQWISVPDSWAGCPSHARGGEAGRRAWRGGSIGHRHVNYSSEEGRGWEHLGTGRPSRAVQAFPGHLGTWGVG